MLACDLPIFAHQTLLAPAQAITDNAIRDMQAVELLLIDADDNSQRIANFHIVGYFVLFVVDLHVAAGHGQFVVIIRIRVVDIIIIFLQLIQLLLVQRAAIVASVVLIAAIGLWLMDDLMLLGLDGSIAAHVGTAHMVAASQIRYQFQMRLQHNCIKELDAAIVLK